MGLLGVWTLCSHLAFMVTCCVDLKIVLFGTRRPVLTHSRSLSLGKKVAIRQNTTTLAKESDRIEQLQNTLIIYPESQKCCSTLIITSQKTLQSITRKRHQVKSLKQNNPNEKVNHSAEIQYSKANSHICDTPM